MKKSFLCLKYELIYYLYDVSYEKYSFIEPEMLEADYAVYR